MSSTRRRKAKRPPPMSEAMWVGYVEDEESVEMIMKKFEVLEKMQQPTTRQEEEPKSHDSGEDRTPADSTVESTLNQEQLEQLFKETSTFSLNTNADDATLVSSYYEDETEVLLFASDEDNEYLDDDEESFFRDDDEPRRKRPKTGLSVRDQIPKSKSHFVDLASDEGFVFTVKKKVRVVDPLQPDFKRIPRPIPASMAKVIQPYSGDDEIQPPNSRYLEIDNVLQFDYNSLKTKQMLAVLIDPPFQTPGQDRSGTVTMQMLEKMNFTSLIHKGFVFLWVEKWLIPQAVRWMEKRDFVYVENLVWVQFEPNNRIVTKDYQYVRRSKKSLLIFKKGEGVELRHQRNPDVVFDYVRENKGSMEDKPQFVYHVIETLLPTSKYDDENGHKLLEIWARKGSTRSGWISVAQK